jgi:hypothetical protein
VGAVVTGLVFLIVGALVYAFNTESHDSKITFNRFGLDLGETETVTVLLALGLFFLGLGAFRWIRSQGPLDDEDELLEQDGTAAAEDESEEPQ